MSRARLALWLPGTQSVRLNQTGRCIEVVSALTTAARNGVLIKGGEYVEALGAVRTLAIDKTGTLTTGRLAVIDFHTDDPVSREFLRDIVTLEARSEHPIAEAIVRFGETRGIYPGKEVAVFTTVPGRGLRGRTNRSDLVIGTEELVGSAVATHWAVRSRTPSGSMR